VLVNSVDRGGPASKAGVRAQDILMAINGQPLNVRFPEEMAPARKRISELPIGKDVKLTLRRGHDVIDLTAKTQKLEGAVGEEKELVVWGLSIRDVTNTYANDQQLDDAEGVVVTTMSPGYPAFKAELRSGDVIRSVNQQPVTDIDEMMKLYNESVKRNDDRVLLEIQRQRGRQSAVMKVTSYPAASTTTTTEASK
jgi:S1-C subfamily serine protease